jgi:branched-chain amino acid transport system permease protein
MSIPDTSDVASVAPALLERNKMHDVTVDWLVFVLVMAVAASVPLLLGGFSLYLGCVVAFYAIAALGLQVMVGLAGQLSLGHAAFLGVGAYGAVLAEQRLGLSFPVACVIGVSLATLAGLLMAQLIRLSGIYFKIATFGFGIILHQFFTNLVPITGGTAGLRGIPPLVIADYALTSRLQLFLLELGALALVYFLLLRLTHGRFGRAFRSLGQNEAAARSIGIPTTRFKMLAIVLGCGIAGFAGTFLPHVMHFVSPESFSWHDSLVLLIMITVGGSAVCPVPSSAQH